MLWFTCEYVWSLLYGVTHLPRARVNHLIPVRFMGTRLGHIFWGFKVCFWLLPLPSRGGGVERYVVNYRTCCFTGYSCWKINDCSTKMPMPFRSLFFQLDWQCNPFLDTSKVLYLDCTSVLSAPRTARTPFENTKPAFQHVRITSANTSRCLRTFSKPVVHGPVAVENLDRGPVVRNLQPLSCHGSFVMGPCLRRTHFKAAEDVRVGSVLRGVENKRAGNIVTGLVHRLGTYLRHEYSNQNYCTTSRVVDWLALIR